MIIGGFAGAAEARTGVVTGKIVALRGSLRRLWGVFMAILVTVFAFAVVFRLSSGFWTRSGVTWRVGACETFGSFYGRCRSDFGGLRVILGSLSIL